jgi:hypothetical protein
MNDKTQSNYKWVFKLAVLGVGMWLLKTPVAKAELLPTARYARGENVDLAFIIQEWRRKHPTVAVFTCVCSQSMCDSSQAWPFRRFTRYQFNVALGRANANGNESIGFKCYDIETGRPPSASDADFILKQLDK